MTAKEYSKIILAALEQGVSGKLKKLVQEKVIHKCDVKFKYDKKAGMEIKSHTIEVLNGYTNSKLNKIIKKIENIEYITDDLDEEIYDGLGEAIAIIKKEITKKD